MKCTELDGHFFCELGPHRMSPLRGSAPNPGQEAATAAQASQLGQQRASQEWQERADRLAETLTTAQARELVEIVSLASESGAREPSNMIPWSEARRSLFELLSWMDQELLARDELVAQLKRERKQFAWFCAEVAADVAKGVASERIAAALAQQIGVLS